MESPEFYQTGYYNTQFPPEKRLSDGKNGENFIIDDLLDFPNEEPLMSTADGGFEETVTGTSAISVADTFFSAGAEPYFHHVGGPHSLVDGFSTELCVPYDELAGLEWLSNIVDESFPCEELDLQKLQLIQGKNAQNTESSKTPQYQFKPENNQTGPIFRPENAQTGPTFRHEMSVPAKARSKRSRIAPGNWASRLLAVSSHSGPATSSSSECDVMTSKKLPIPEKKEGPEEEGRRCLHCATDKTPQWRSGPMGRKTLCNACGVRFKSGRLVPEYRPASSPTFVLTKHSNSHRKVLELRRQKEMVRAQQHQQFLHQNMMFDVPNGDDYLIHQHIGPDFRQMI